MRVTAAALRRSAESQRASGRLLSRPFVRIGLLLVGVLAFIALFQDAATIRRVRSRGNEWGPNDIAALGLGVSDARRVDPAGRFAVTLPSAWREVGGQEAKPYDARFVGPRELELAIRVNDLQHSRFERLLRDTMRIEEDSGVPMNIRTNEFRGRPSIERTCRLVQQGVFVVDFLVGHTAHHIQFVAPREVYERVEPLFRDILATYDPEPPPAPPAAP